MTPLPQNKVVIMKRLFALTIVLLMLVFAEMAAAAGSCSVAAEVYAPRGDMRYTVYRFAWASDTSGDVSAGSGVVGHLVSGTIIGVNFKSVSTAVPTDLYDVQLLTTSGENVLYDDSSGANAGADIPSAISASGQRRTPLDADGNYKKLHNEFLTPSITGAGANKSGVVELVVW